MAITSLYVFNIAWLSFYWNHSYIKYDSSIIYIYIFLFRASSAGIDSLFIAGGIHAEELGIPPRRHGDGIISKYDIGQLELGASPTYDIGQLEALSDRLGAYPTYSTAYLEW